MTWVIGASTIWGYGVVISDVQVTFRDGTTADMLQKAYPLSNFIVGGFAGSVRIGFALLQSLRDFLTIPEGARTTHAWNPLWVAEQWPPIARDVYNHMPAYEQVLGSKILLVAAHPTRVHAFGSQVVFARFVSPNFTAGIMTKPIKVCSIGSGAGIAEYKRNLKPLFRLESGLIQGEVGVPGGWGRTLTYSVSRILNSAPHAGISRHLHQFEIRNGTIQVANNDETIYPREGNPIIIRMPPVARGYAQFLSMARRMNVSSAEAEC